LPKAIGIIPARYGSTRFPGKPLAEISGRPMIQHVYRRAVRARLLDEVWVATDDQRIAQCVCGFGGRVILTSPRHSTGSDRVFEALSKIERGRRRYNIVVNIQGDEPLLEPRAIDLLIQRLREDRQAQIATAVHPVSNPKQAADHHTVKVALDRWQRALYFSRSPIPFHRNGIARQSYYQHIGIYAYRRPALEKFCRLKRGRLEQAEELEQLRALENGMEMAVVILPKGWPAVDEPGHIAKIERLMRRKIHRPPCG